ncbi:MAG: four helix bundle protein [Bacteroidota bacterium]|nr:four helix bundle protein [Bacteroidota bacterium]
MKKNIVKEKSLELSFMAIDIYKELLASNEYILSKQFLRSSTSIGANIFEADGSYSKKEFASKMSISSKEAKETAYWTILLKYGNFIDRNWEQFDNQLLEVTKLLTAIVKTSHTREFINH